MRMPPTLDFSSSFVFLYTRVFAVLYTRLTPFSTPPHAVRIDQVSLFRIWETTRYRRIHKYMYHMYSSAFSYRGI